MPIRSKREYINTVREIAIQDLVINEQRKQLEKEGLSPEEINRGIEPLESFTMGLRDEVKWYEDMLQGKFPQLRNFQGLGLLLIGMRIYRQLTVAQLAIKAGLEPKVLERWEYNEYYQAPFSLLDTIITALNYEIVSHIES